MNRILIVGSGGAGKTTLARQLGELLHLEVIHLDQHFWNSGWRECAPDEWNAKVRNLIAKDQWVMDGNYGGTLEIRARAADTIVFLDFSRWQCLWGIVSRRIRYHGRTRPSMPDNCPERLSWEFVRYVWNYPRTRRPAMLDRLKGYEAAGKQIFILRNRRAARDWIRSFS
ncbi:DNA topology modulation protein [Flavilitoribacter nigricans]|uniref:AAA family ATPase n=1 Tax=Flavilitoribacter nigricans (strain ATCC 23147 / DSM 23189 / NBRC 102662 / NCIMB 1420 / SS-2) TaxID=1122177 RepID=A0A2D0N5G9_FLAN2|nr:DNA topology modulation protein [Flavilitoribacter nigricans]PHN03013.1 AAA family ATPase [Flavilitoribacter nigricans DSM 23189 = NBRC 102662]